MFTDGSEYPLTVGWPPYETTQGNSAVQPDIDYWIVLCQWCGKPHYGKLCPHVKEIEYHTSGVVKRVVFRDGVEQFENMDDFIESLDLPKDDK